MTLFNTSLLGSEGMSIDGGYYEIPNTNKITNQFSIIKNEVDRLDEYGMPVEPTVYDCEIGITLSTLQLIKPSLDEVLASDYASKVHKLVRFDDMPIPVFSNTDTMYISYSNYMYNNTGIDNSNQLLRVNLDITKYQLLDVYDYLFSVSNKVETIIAGDNLNNSRITSVD